MIARTLKRKAQSQGQKSPFDQEQVQLIRALLEKRGVRNRTRDLALFEVALSTCLRACDLLALRVSDVTASDGTILPTLAVMQQKTHRPVEVRLGERARKALGAWITLAGYSGGAKVFCLCREHYGALVKGWAEMIGADPRRYSTHSMRRTHPAHLYAKTHNVAAAANMLGHSNLAHTIVYLGLGVAEAHKLAEEHEL